MYSYLYVIYIINIYMCNYTYVFTYKYTQHTHIYIKQTQTMINWFDSTSRNICNYKAVTAFKPNHITKLILPYLYLLYCTVHIQDSTE